MTRATRLGYLVSGWCLVIWGVVSYPIPLYPSTPTIVAGLLLIAKVQPWARRLIVRARRRFRPFNRLYLRGARLFHRRHRHPPADGDAEFLPPLSPESAGAPPGEQPSPATP